MIKWFGAGGRRKRFTHQQLLDVWETVHAPHIAIPQPNLVPVRPSSSRRTQRRGVVGSDEISRSEPLILSFMVASPAGGQGPTASRRSV